MKVWEMNCIALDNAVANVIVMKITFIVNTFVQDEYLFDIKIL